MSASLSTVAISPLQDIVDDMRAGRMVILVDEEDRENEGDLVLALADCPECVVLLMKVR